MKSDRAFVKKDWKKYEMIAQKYLLGKKINTLKHFMFYVKLGTVRIWGLVNKFSLTGIFQKVCFDCSHLEVKKIHPTLLFESAI